MVFSTYLFIFYFLPAVLLAYYLIPRSLVPLGLSTDTESRLRNGILLGASWVFYAWWDPWFLPLMVFVTVVNHLAGRAVSPKGAGPRRRLAATTVAVVLSLGTLGFFKYFTFVATNLNLLLEWVGLPPMPAPTIVLPIGISFYVFQALSYTLDVYRGSAPAARSLADFACYVALFPQLVAGPIVRYNTVAGQLRSRSHTWERFSSGVALFILGLAKKVLIANPLGEVADAAFSARSIAPGDAWFGATAYAFQIYFDFSGYSDMAIGLGRMVGFEFPKNFDAPYRSESITEFWRRWHISLSTFLRDYLYFPLGGNRLGPLRTYLNLGIVMLLGGLWHGACWTFVAWGAFHGALLCGERLLGKRSPYRWLPRPGRVAATFVLVLFSWVLFRSETLADAIRYSAAMFGMGSGDGAAEAVLSTELYTRGSVALMLLSALLVIGPLQADAWCRTITPAKALALAPAFGVAVAAMLAQSYSPFLYFQF